MNAISETVRLCGQLSAADIHALASDGIQTIINNRPDNEMPFQVKSDDLAEAAQSAGLTYFHIPMASGVSPEMIAASEAAYKEASGPVVAFCKSGMRSAALWCFAHVKEQGVDKVLEQAASAGYALEQLRGPLSAYLEQSRES